MSAWSFARRLAVVFVAALVLTGCANRWEPVYNVQEHPISQPNLTTDKVGKAITTAAASVPTLQRWTVTPNGTGAMKARVTWDQKFTANADIKYSNRSYSIVLVDAVADLHGKDDLIHRNYNRAVRALEQEIDRQLQLAANP
jgi:hypothetical protein